MSPEQISALIKYVPSFVASIIGDYKGPYIIKETERNNEVMLCVPLNSTTYFFPYRFTYNGQNIEIYLNNLSKHPLQMRRITK